MLIRVNEDLFNEIEKIKQKNNLKTYLELLEFLVEKYNSKKEEIILKELIKQTKTLDKILLLSEINIADNMTGEISEKKDRDMNDRLRTAYQQLFNNNKDKFMD